MTHQDALPATSVLLLAAALLLFGAGGGLVGYVAGERQGQQRATVIIQALGSAWQNQQGQVQHQFDGAIGDAAARLERVAEDLRSQVSMYHGCGAICGAIAYQFSQELLRARDSIKAVELRPAAGWNEVVGSSATAVTPSAPTAPAELSGMHSGWTLFALVGLLCLTVALCFGLACFTLLKLRAGAAQET